MLPQASVAPDGSLYVVNGAAGPNDVRVGGVLVTPEGSIHINANAPQRFDQGKGFSSAGDLSIDVLGTPVAGYVGGLPVTANGALKCQLNQPVSPGDAFVGGIRVGPLGGVYITDTTPVVPFSFSNGFSDGFDAVPSSGGGFSPADLFTSGEQGAWYDPSDFGTMFQDSFGITQVTAVGQSVGLILDKSNDLVLGSELITNGAFASDVSGWSIMEGSGSLTWDSGAALLSATSSPAACQILTTVPGKWYKLSVSVVSATALAGVSVGNGWIYGFDRFYTINATGAREISGYFMAIGANSTICLYAGGTTGVNAMFDNVSVKEIAGNHASQATSASRPQLQQDGNGKYYLAFDGVDDSLSTAAFTAISASPLWTAFIGMQRVLDATMTLCTNSFNDANKYFGVCSDGDGANANFIGESAYRVNGAALSGAPNTTRGQLAAAVSYATNRVITAENLTLTGWTKFFPVVYGAGFQTQARLYSFIIRGAVSTTQEITDTETWVNSKTGAF